MKKLRHTFNPGKPTASDEIIVDDDSGPFIATIDMDDSTP